MQKTQNVCTLWWIEQPERIMAIQKKEWGILLRTELSSIPRLIQPYHVCEGGWGGQWPAYNSINENKPWTLVEWTGHDCNVSWRGQYSHEVLYKGTILHVIPKGLQNFINPKGAEIFINLYLFICFLRESRGISRKKKLVGQQQAHHGDPVEPMEFLPFCTWLISS